METRRGFIRNVGAAIGAGALITPVQLPLLADDPDGGTGKHPPMPADGQLRLFWDKPVRELVQLPAPELSVQTIERHRIYCGLLAALVVHYWNGNKRGENGVYPWREKQKQPNGTYHGGDYLGHNIACLAVSGDGKVLDFDFNHNEIFHSSVEHAESRLVRRLFSLAQLHENWAERKLGAGSYSSLLKDVTVYTSLESCSQCSGIMALGSVKEVVFLQRDPSQNSIGNILRQLSDAKESFRPPLPIPADLLGVAAFQSLDTGFRDFVAGLETKPFFEPKVGNADKSRSITSFLCTDLALDAFQGSRKEFDDLVLKFPDYRPGEMSQAPSALTNQKALDHAKAFFAYASTAGRRGTPHQL